MKVSSMRGRAPRALLFVALLSLVGYRLPAQLQAQSGPRVTATPQKLSSTNATSSGRNGASGSTNATPSQSASSPGR